MSSQEQDIDSLTKRVEQLHEAQVSAGTKGALIEKITFASIPIMFSCIVYLMSALSAAQHDVTVIQSKINVVVSAENKAISPQGTTIEMEKIKEEAALARSAMTLERVKDTLAMKEEAALSRAKVAADSAAARAELDKRIAVVEWRLNNANRK
jgi:hypothetical protein